MAGELPKLPLLIFDGECQFCRRWIARWRRRTGDRVDYQPFQEVAGQFPGIPRQAFESSVQLIEPGGKVTEGADAIFRTMEYAPVPPGFLALRHVPGFMVAARAIYRLVARNRGFFSKFAG